jgi:hypothetical protein
MHADVICIINATESTDRRTDTTAGYGEAFMGPLLPCCTGMYIPTTEFLYITNTTSITNISIMASVAVAGIVLHRLDYLMLTIATALLCALHV